VLRVEDVHVVCALLLPLEPEVRLAVWEQLLPTLRSDVERDVVRPRARLRELVDRIVRQVDAAGAQQRRDNAREGRAVSYRRRDDGLVDLFAFGLTGPLAQACLSRIRDAAAPLGPADPAPPISGGSTRWSACSSGASSCPSTPRASG
jgi:hypothetical protein